MKRASSSSSRRETRRRFFLDLFLYFLFLDLFFFSHLFILDKEEAVVSPVVNQVADDDDRQPIPEGKVTKRKSVVVSITRTITELER